MDKLVNLNTQDGAAVIIGGGRTFIAGADIKELELAASGRGSGPPKFHDILARIEDSSKPVVMAIHGTALGGGNEVAMAGHYRVAVPDAQIGQPEVNLGIRHYRVAVPDAQIGQPEVNLGI